MGEKHPYTDAGKTFSMQLNFDGGYLGNYLAIQSYHTGNILKIGYRMMKHPLCLFQAGKGTSRRPKYCEKIATKLTVLKQNKQTSSDL